MRLKTEKKRKGLKERRAVGVGLGLKIGVAVGLRLGLWLGSLLFAPF